MTNANNGATLEDCHSNFFALTDLCGIKWRRLVWDGIFNSAQPHQSFGPLDDPVLSSFSRCLASDVLCVWRKSPNPKLGGPPSTPNDPFHPNPPPPHFMHHGQNTGGPPQPNHPSHMIPMQPHHLPQNMMPLPPHMNMMGGHIPPPHHMGGPSYPHNIPQHPHGMGMPPQQGSMPNHASFASAPPTLNGPKELWLFWYGEDPDLSNLVNPQLLKAEADQGSWESGLSYECRTLLFKALHNLIERCLLARDFVRIGKWFIQPVDDLQRQGLKNFPAQLSFTFTFFVHGESTVCMSVDVRQHPPIRRVGKHHLASCHSPNMHIPVILAPYGLAANLTGIGYRLNDPGTHKILEEWKHFYPVDAALKSSMYDSSLPTGPHASPHPLQGSYPTSTSGAIPPVLEVVVGGMGGVRMRHPACYVLTTDMDDVPKISEVRSIISPSTNKGRTPGSTDPDSAAFAFGGLVAKPQLSAGPAQEVEKLKCLLPERVWQECMMCTSKAGMESSASNNQAGGAEGSGTTSTDTIGQWDFTDPTKKYICSCSTSRSKRMVGGRSGSNWPKGSTRAKRSLFHKRNGQGLLLVDGRSKYWDLAEEPFTQSPPNASQPNASGLSRGPDAQSQSNVSSGNSRIGGAPGTPIGGPPSKPGTGNLVIGRNDVPGPSPLSVAPSPLSNSGAMLQGSSIQPVQPVQTQSPQSSNAEKSSVHGQVDPNAPKSLSSQNFSPLVKCFEGYTKPENGENRTANEGHSQKSPASSSVHPTNYQESPQSSSRNVLKRGLQRPNLPTKEYEPLLEEEHENQPSDIIYDYAGLEAWLHPPIKRLKHNQEGVASSEYVWGLGIKKVQPGSESENSQSSHFHRSSKGHNDPYEFDDENHRAPAVNMEGLKRKDEKIKDEPRSPHFLHEKFPVVEKKADFFTIAGLGQPSLSDLDKMFDNSDSSGDDEILQPTPPGSNKPSGAEENKVTTVKHNSNLGILRPEELSKMFPTPPSHEHNPISSPCGLPDSSSMELLGDISSCLRRPQEIYPGLSSPDEPSAEIRVETTLFMKLQPCAKQNLPDWSYVYKPPTIYKMLGSSKYAPLAALPSQQLPPINILPNSTYKASWQYPPPPPPPQPSQPHGHHPHLPPQQMMCMGGALPGQMHLRPGLSPISPVPNSIRGSHSFDLGSPPPGSMYLKQGSGMQHSHGPHPHPPPHQIYGSRGVEAHSLVVNLSLSDSVINLFRDHNFDSCTMCVCNAGNRVVGNIRGSEVGVYIPDLTPDEDTVRCNCGFSASVNRRLAHRAGLFYEDEFEVTTAANTTTASALLNDEWYEKKKASLLLLDPKYPNMGAILADKEGVAASGVVDSVPPYLLDMVREQCLLLFGSSMASRFTGEVIHHKWTERTYNFLDYLDGNRAALTALEHGSTVMMEASGRSPYARLPEDGVKQNLFWMHKWPYLWARGPHSSQEIMQVMKALLPLLQDAVHAKAWDAQYNVSGPLTWRQFHRLAGRGTDDRCEPQPIPSVLVGLERDWVGLSPLSIKYWEKLLLEPYAYPRDIAYIVVAPDNDYILQKTRTFFRELTSMYEVCQLGRHCPISKVLRDGILRVGKSAAAKLSSEPIDEWFSTLPDIPAAATLRLYAQVCRHYLAPQLVDINLDQSLLETPTAPPCRNIAERPTPSPKMPPPNSETPSGGTPPQGPTTPKNEYDSNDYGAKDVNGQDGVDDERDPPALVIYLIEPFGFGSDNKDLHRMASLGLFRCFASMLNFVPENTKNNITLQIISLEDIMNIGNSSLDGRFKHDQMRALSLTIYSQCRRFLVHQSGIRSLTGFGPAATTEAFLKNKETKMKESYKLFTPPYVLAPVKEKVTEGVEWLGNLQSVGGMVSSGTSSNGLVMPTSSSVLYVAYCISEDHRWLLASATDDRGELVETTIISIYVPNRSKRRKASARKHGLTKLMDFILGVMSTGIQPWRLVVGRLGRVGHGELESWSTLLSKKSLLRASNQLKDACRQCSLQYPLDTPCVLSACLVSLEPDSCLRLMPDQFTPDERFGVTSNAAACTGSSTLSTPHDVSCSHILVFPTSATTQSSQTAFQEQHINCNDMGDEDLLFGETEDITDGIDGMQDLQLGDIFSSWDTGPGASSPINSPRRDSSSQPGSPGGIGTSGRQSPFQGIGTNRVGSRGEGSEELGSLLQQPLALGYLVSTAPPGNLPPWFWASCPHRASEDGTGVFFKSALHIHSHSVLHSLDDLLQQQSSAKQHPLDSQFTTDVLRFVLEGYNALSWLCLDPKSHDRKSCLPVHIQRLLQLYFTISTLV